MRVWTNTATLDKVLPELRDQVPPEEAQIAVIGSRTIDIDTFPALKGIFKCGVGTDNVPFDKAAERGIKIGLPSLNTRQYIFEETANFAVQLVFRMLYANTGDIDIWTKAPRPFLGERRVLVIGRGNIGRLVEAKLSPFLKVTTYDVEENEPRHLKPLVREADAVSLHIPLTAATRGLIDAEKLSWMKTGSALVNTARGAVVDEDALYDELSRGRLRAAFDVYWREPYDGKLKTFHPDRFLMSPHVASSCLDFMVGLASDLKKFIHQLT